MHKGNVKKIKFLKFILKCKATKTQLVYRPTFLAEIRI